MDLPLQDGVNVHRPSLVQCISPDSLPLEKSKPS